jgi:hypothetical protein
LPCLPGTYNAGVGAASPAACVPCPASGPGVLVPEGSLAGSPECWPGVVSVVASNPPPLKVGFSVGDVVTVTFTKATNTPTVPVAFSPDVGGLAFSWQNQGSVLVRYHVSWCRGAWRGGWAGRCHWVAGLFL